MSTIRETQRNILYRTLMSLILIEVQLKILLGETKIDTGTRPVHCYCEGIMIGVNMLIFLSSIRDEPIALLVPRQASNRMEKCNLIIIFSSSVVLAKARGTALKKGLHGLLQCQSQSCRSTLALARSSVYAQDVMVASKWIRFKLGCDSSTSLSSSPCPPWPPLPAGQHIVAPSLAMWQCKT